MDIYRVSRRGLRGKRSKRSAKRSVRRRTKRSAKRTSKRVSRRTKRVSRSRNVKRVSRRRNTKNVKRVSRRRNTKNVKRRSRRQTRRSRRRVMRGGVHHRIVISTAGTPSIIRCNAVDISSDSFVANVKIKQVKRSMQFTLDPSDQIKGGPYRHVTQKKTVAYDNLTGDMDFLVGGSVRLLTAIGGLDDDQIRETYITGIDNKGKENQIVHTNKGPAVNNSGYNFIIDYTPPAAREPELAPPVKSEEVLAYEARVEADTRRRNEENLHALALAEEHQEELIKHKKEIEAGILSEIQSERVHHITEHNVIDRMQEFKEIFYSVINKFPSLLDDLDVLHRGDVQLMLGEFDRHKCSALLHMLHDVRKHKMHHRESLLTLGQILKQLQN